jgi:catechol 2,3-dioxygenase-like lactoylglutathione lyase family enzyme
MLTAIHPKLPMRDKAATRHFYIDALGFRQFGGDYNDYLMVEKDGIQIHFFQHTELNPAENYGQVYIRTNNIDEWYRFVQSKEVKAMPLQTKPWGQKEFALLDPDNNLLTFGQDA